MLSVWTDWLRVVNLILGSMALLHLLRFWYKRRPLPRWLRDQWVIWVVVSTSIVLLAIDGILRHVPVTARTLFLTLIGATLVRGIYAKHLWPYVKQSEEDSHADLY